MEAALAAIREVALDKGESDEHRCKAVTAYAKVLCPRRRHEEALKLCGEVLRGTDKAPVAEAALKAGCLIERDRCGHLRGERDFLAAWTDGAPGRAAAALREELNRAAYALATLAGRSMVPAPVPVRAPSWAVGQGPLRGPIPELQPPAWYRFQPPEPPPALRVTRPKMEPPDWLRRLTFPPIKEPRT